MSWFNQKKNKPPKDWELIKRNLPVNHEGWKILGKSFLDEGKYDEAIVAYYRSIELKGDSADTYVNLGVALFNSNDLDAAIKYYNKAIELLDAADADLSPLQSEAGELAAQSDEPDEVAQIKSVAYHNLGVAYHAQNNPDTAITFLKKAIDLNAKNENAFMRLGTLFFERAKYEEALDYYLQALELKPDHVAVTSQTGWVYLLLDNLKKASYYLQKAWELSKEADFYSAMNIGHIELLKDQPDVAQKWYRKSLALTEGKDRASFSYMMQSDYTDLQMRTKGIDETWYDDMVRKIIAEIEG